MLVTTQKQAPTEASLPVDLSGWVEKQALVSLILDAQRAVDWSRPALKKAAREIRGLRPQMLLTLLSYCYATGVYPSQEIERRATSDETVRYVCANSQPDWQTLIRFRRLYRELLKQCLVSVFQRVWKAQFEPWDWDEDEVDFGDTSVEVGRFDPEVYRQLAQAADARIERAAQLDSMMLDE